MKKEKQFGSVYEFEGRVPLRRALPLGIQHVLAMFKASPPYLPTFPCL